jgi:CHAD domain-containing protein/CYTH domain-containing protein
MYLEDAVVARRRVERAADPEALHDYRVAIRHLRSTVRAYRRPLKSSVGGSIRRQLRRLAQATNRPRDLDVQLAWLTDRLAGSGREEQPGIEWLVSRMGETRERAIAEMRAVDARLFPPVAARLESRLPRLRTTLALDDRIVRRSTAGVTARLVRRTAARLRDRLESVRSYADSDVLHRARIAAKRLRYLLEPFSDFLPSCESAVIRLRDLQDALGDVHDAQTFDAELLAALPEAWLTSPAGPGSALLPGLRAVRTARDVGGKQAFEHARTEWLGGAATPFFETIAGLADGLAGLAHGGREIERKFLLRRLPPAMGAARVVEIEQGYLPGERLIERVRRVRSDQGEELVRTLKTGTGLTRLEIEEPVTPELFIRLWPLTEGRRVHKRRYRMSDGALTWEIDQFLDRDLVLAEVELDGESREVTLPEWLAPHVDREVTEDQAYSNLRLAVQGAA